MWPFNFKRKESPAATIQRLIDYMPEHYRNHNQFKHCIEYMSHHEWGLALESLIELADETEHYFSEEFWNGLANAADKMQLKDKASYSRERIDRNKRDVKNKIPFGWTTVKIDDTHFQYYISERVKDEWAKERREKDNVLDLINRNGVHLKSQGRAGSIYLVDKGRMAEIGFELGSNGLFLYFNNVDHWTIPTRVKMTVEERIKIEQQLTTWSIETKNPIEFC